MIFVISNRIVVILEMNLVLIGKCIRHKTKNQEKIKKWSLLLIMINFKIQYQELKKQRKVKVLLYLINRKMIENNKCKNQ